MFKDEKTDRTVVAKIQDLEGLEQRRPGLSFMSGPAMGQLHLLKDGEHGVGRSKDASIAVFDEAISRQHFKLIVKGHEVILEDLGSTNGTFVNGKRVTRHLLQDKDTIQISAQTVIHFTYVNDLEAQKQLQIYHMANFDPVTQARTKYYFLDRIEQEFSHARRKHLLLSLLIFDVDFFKKVNDMHGHPAGDYVLKRLAELTYQIIRQEDLFARYGGEEFVILMRDTSEGDAVRLAERLRQLIAGTFFEFDGKVFHVTISSGVSSLKNDNFTNHAEMIKAADQYLYFAKQNGRNRVAALSVLKNP